MMLAAVVANLLMLSTTAQPIEQDEAVAEKLTQTYVTYMPEPVIRQEEPERDMSAWTDAAAYIAKTVYGEAMVCGTTERAAVVWCILNRADDARDATPAGVIAVVTKPYQFHGYGICSRSSAAAGAGGAGAGCDRTVAGRKGRED